MRTERKPTTPENNLAKRQRPLAPLKELPQWAGWKWTKRRDGWQKAPYQVDDPRHYASVTNPATWSTFDATLAAVQDSIFDGASFVLSKDTPLGFGDLDNCISPPYARSAASWARPFIKRARDAGVWVEYSPSGTGLRFVGEISESAAEVHRNEPFKSGRVEIFRRCAKALTITGRAFGKGSKKKLGCIDGWIDWAIVTVDRYKAKALKAASTTGTGGNGVDHDFDEIEALIQDGPDSQRASKAVARASNKSLIV